MATSAHSWGEDLINIEPFIVFTAQEKRLIWK
jgi:hypothetical protein